MRKTIVGATFVVFAAGASAVGALDNVALQGSDTLERLTNDVLASCPGVSGRGITYRGGGSTTGGNAMVAGTQTVAPQSRALSATEGCTNGGATSEGLVIALDGLSIVTAASTGGMCAGGLAFSTSKALNVTNAAGAPVDCTANGCTGSVYNLGSWKDVLALVYGGVHKNASKNCASDVRRTLVNTWTNLFEGACPAGQCPTGLQRAYRRADLSGTTDTFVTLVGLNSMPLAQNVPGAAARVIDFCNAYANPAVARFGGESDFLDEDPIRRTCANNEQVCGRTGNLGLVTVIEIPANLTAAQNYPTTLCGLGQFRFVAPAVFMGPTICPNGQPKLFNKCFQPVINDASLPGGFTADCVARRFPVQGIGGSTIPDGRAYNLNAKNANGTYRTDNLGRHITGAFYRIHTTAVVAAGAATCQRAERHRPDRLPDPGQPLQHRLRRPRGRRGGSGHRRPERERPGSLGREHPGPGQHAVHRGRLRPGPQAVVQHHPRLRGPDPGDGRARAGQVHGSERLDGHDRQQPRLRGGARRRPLRELHQRHLRRLGHRLLHQQPARPAVALIDLT